MNGVELCEAIREDPKMGHIPLVVVSGSVDPHDARAAACFTAVMAKPSKPQDLLAQLNSVLAGSR
ncbi:hypothetical protein Aca07nite_45200 [Actinoplanes capillaceus]|uniref:Response regulatory domain-containing protein n=2 Tax=Actinoplanes campanulatus TaxID=113559 RepID=A0ABQ3WLV3_9ACTN|nr:hypothetical protein Aca07nite_45200 [Actinoplanes capillaceus]